MTVQHTGREVGGESDRVVVIFRETFQLGVRQDAFFRFQEYIQLVRIAVEKSSESKVVSFTQTRGGVEVIAFSFPVIPLPVFGRVIIVIVPGVWRSSIFRVLAHEAENILTTWGFENTQINTIL